MASQRKLRRLLSASTLTLTSVVIPGLGQVYNGRLVHALLWFLAVGFGYAAVLVPGFLLHVICVYCAYKGAKDWRGY